METLKANELRIGNYVYFNGNHKHIGIVSSIQPKNIIKCCRSVEYSNDIKIGLNNRFDILYDLDRLKPIPLTEEILLKFGFDIELGTMTLIVKFLDVKIKYDNYGIRLGYGSYYELKNIKYVHQIQNLYFALTGEELTFNN